MNRFRSLLGSMVRALALAAVAIAISAQPAPAQTVVSGQTFPCAISSTAYVQCYAAYSGVKYAHMLVDAWNASNAPAPEIHCWDTIGMSPVGNMIVINGLGQGQINPFLNHTLFYGLLCAAVTNPTATYGTVFLDVK